MLPSLVHLPTRVADVNGYLDEWLSEDQHILVFANLLPIEAANALRSHIAHSFDATGPDAWNLLGKLLVEREYGGTTALTMQEHNRRIAFMTAHNYSGLLFAATGIPSVAPTGVYDLRNNLARYWKADDQWMPGNPAWYMLDLPTGPYTQPQLHQVSPAQKMKWATAQRMELPSEFSQGGGMAPLSPQYQKWFDFLVHIPLLAILAVVRPLKFEYTISSNYLYDENDPGAIVFLDNFVLTGMHEQSNKDGVSAILLWLALLRKAPSLDGEILLGDAQEWASRIWSSHRRFVGDYSLSGFYYPLTNYDVFEIFQQWIVVRNGVEVDESPDTWINFNPAMNSGKLVVRIVKHALPA